MGVARCLPFELDVLKSVIALLLLRESIWDTHYEPATGFVATDENEDM